MSSYQGAFGQFGIRWVQNNIVARFRVAKTSNARADP